MTAMLAALLMLAVAACSAVEPCGTGGRDWASSCFTEVGGVRQVKPAYLGNIPFGAGEHATIVIGQPRELVAVDHRGVVVVPGIFHTGDFDYPPPNGELVRFRSGAKCGYFDPRNFQIRIPAAYDHCRSFQQQVAAVCNDCEVYCTEKECQDSTFVGGTGFELDHNNRVLRRFSLQALARACNGKPPAKVEKGARAYGYLQCAPGHYR